MAASDADGPFVEASRAVPVARRQRRRTAAVAGVSLAVGVVLGAVAAPAFEAGSSDVVTASADSDGATTLVEPTPEQVPDPTPVETTVPVSAPGAPDDEAPEVPPAATAAPPPQPVQPADEQQPPARQRFAATLEAEPGWAPTERFAGTITVVELEDGSWTAFVVAEGLQPSHRHGAGVSWDAPFFSSFCVGMSDEAGRWTCTGRLDMQHVPPGAKLIGGDLGEASGRIWAHGPMRPA